MSAVFSDYVQHQKKRKSSLTPLRYNLAASTGEMVYFVLRQWPFCCCGRSNESRLQLLHHSFRSKYNLGKANLILISISWHPTWFQIFSFYSGIRVHLHTLGYYLIIFNNLEQHLRLNYTQPQFKSENNWLYNREDAKTSAFSDTSVWTRGGNLR